MSERMTTVLDDPLVAALAKLGERYDAERAHPADSIALLAEAGLLRRFAPVESGGEAFADANARHRAMFDALRRVGRGIVRVQRLLAIADRVARLGRAGNRPLTGRELIGIRQEEHELFDQTPRRSSRWD